MVRWIIRSARVLAAAAIALAAAGAAFELVSGWQDARRFPQRGRSVQAGAVRLNLDCSGTQRSPTIILDSGMGVPAFGWFKVQPEVAKFARVCSYDRAGYGWSEPGPEPRTSLQIARELKALLMASGEQGPYVLVGHSFGGFNVRVFNSLFPKDVAGVVFADASHEDEEERINAMLPAAVREREKAEQRSREILDPILTPLRIHLGFKRWQAMARWRGPTDLPKDVLQELFYLRQQAKYRSAVQSESEAHRLKAVALVTGCKPCSGQRPARWFPHQAGFKK